jgi:hypothetical protein
MFLPRILPKGTDHHPRVLPEAFLAESGDHVQEFKVNRSRPKNFYTEPLKE